MRRISKSAPARVAIAATIVAGAFGGIASISSAKSAHPAAALGSVDFYSSLPLVGSSSAQTKPAVNGMKLALQQAGNKAGH